MRSRHEIRSEVRRHRQAAGMTQQELADRIGVSRQTVVSIEKDKYTPSVALALRLAAVFQVTVEELFSLEEGSER